MKLKDIEKHFVVDMDIANPVETWAIALASTDLASYGGGSLPKGFLSELPVMFDKDIATLAAKQLTELTGQDFGVYRISFGTKKPKTKTKKKPAKKAKKK